MKKLIATVLICLISFPVFSAKGRRGKAARAAVKDFKKKQNGIRQTEGFSRQTVNFAKKWAAFDHDRHHCIGLEQQILVRESDRCEHRALSRQLASKDNQHLL